MGSRMGLPLEVDKHSGVPIYFQLGQRIRLLIHQGALRSGDAMPTVRGLAVQLGVNANTVARVYRELQGDGLLRLERGVGTFVAEVADTVPARADLRRLEAKVLELIQLARQAGLTSNELSQFIETRWQETQDASRL